MAVFHFPIDDESELRILEVRHAEDLFEAVDRCRDHLRPWLPWVDGTQRVSDTRVFIRTGLKQFAENLGFHAGLWHLGKLSGVCGYHRICWSNRSVSLGYWLAEDCQGRGLMTKSVRVLTSHALQELELNRVEIRCAPENTRSRAIPERLGFQEEGLLRESEWISDHYVDHVVYGMLRSQWDPSKD